MAACKDISPLTLGAQLRFEAGTVHFCPRSDMCDFCEEDVIEKH